MAAEVHEFPIFDLPLRMGAADVLSATILDAKGRTVHYMMGPDAQQRAERIAACVNYCGEASTDYLSRTSVGRMYADARLRAARQLDSVTAERDTLRRALDAHSEQRVHCAATIAGLVALCQRIVDLPLDPRDTLDSVRAAAESLIAQAVGRGLAVPPVSIAPKQAGAVL